MVMNMPRRDFVDTKYTTPAHDKTTVCSPNKTSTGYQQLYHRFLWKWRHNYFYTQILSHTNRTFI